MTYPNTCLAHDVWPCYPCMGVANPIDIPKPALEAAIVAAGHTRWHGDRVTQTLIGLQAAIPLVPARLDETAVDAALRKTIEHLDYDTHKYLECDEETGEDTYPEHVARFVAAYNDAVAGTAHV